jgi:hypothetical protein
VWDRAVSNRILRFHLGGLNHQNFLMIDEQTGSWWQQITGECILGPLKGARLRRIDSDEVTLAIWRAEHPESDAVRFDPRYLDQYPKSDWERRIAGVPPPPGTRPGPIGARDLVVGVELDGAAAAFPLAALRKYSPVNTQLGHVPLLLVVADDGQSVRCFVRPKAVEFYRRVPDGALIDAASGTVWTFGGKAVAGPMAGSALERVQVTKDFWFDWKQYHPAGVLRSSGF